MTDEEKKAQNSRQVELQGNFEVKWNKFAIASMMLVLLTFVGVIIQTPTLIGGSLLAIIAGHIGFYQTRNHRQIGRGFAIAGMIVGYLLFLFVLWGLLPLFFILHHHAVPLHNA